MQVFDLAFDIVPHQIDFSIYCLVNFLLYMEWNFHTLKLSWLQIGLLSCPQLLRKRRSSTFVDLHDITSRDYLILVDWDLLVDHLGSLLLQLIKLVSEVVSRRNLIS